jgi:hypothetical protein
MRLAGALFDRFGGALIVGAVALFGISERCQGWRIRPWRSASRSPFLGSPPAR